MSEEMNDDMIEKFQDLINYFDKPLVVAIGFADHSIVLANKKMTDRPHYDKQAVLGMMTTGLVDYLSYDIDLDLDFGPLPDLGDDMDDLLGDMGL